MASVSSSLPSWPSESNSTTLRDVSFSSYLNTSEESYIRSLVLPQGSSKNKAEEGEIDVFNADKYFSGGGVEHGPHKDRIVEVVNQPRTPSYQSESSSWNSQSTLLRRVQRIPSRGNNIKTQGKRLFLPCCSCSDKNSVNVEDELMRVQGKRDVSLKSIKTSLDTAKITRMSKLRLERETSDPFFFPPMSDSPARSLTTRVKKIQQQQQQPSVNPVSTGFGEVQMYAREDEEDERRKSLEVFGSSKMLDDHGIVERRLNMLSWDAIPRVATHEIINSEIGSGPPSESYKDTDSDASSDLFEIECLSCSANPVVVGGPQCASDGSATPTTCYAPSEASIEWSVVTASAADFSSTVFSDSEDQRSAITSVTRRKMMPPKMNPLGKMNPSGKMPGMLLGCKSQKAVRVAGEVYRTPIPREKLERERRQRYSDQFIAMTRFQAEAKMAGFGQKQRKDAARSPRWSHSSHASELLYIQ